MEIEEVFYKEKIIKMLEGINSEKILRYIYIIIADIIKEG